MVTNSRAKAATKPRSKAKTKAGAKKKTTGKTTGGKSALRGSAAGKSLVIVESPAKARTVGQILGNKYVVTASQGHVRDLPRIWPTVRAFAAALTADLARNGITIVSGLARGIDGIAHRAALDNGGRTFAVVANGLDIVYPWEHAKLSQRAEEQGAVISEYPLGVKPHPRSFPRRNRLISGMSLGTLVIEAPETSGAVWTVQHALEQNREVFCVPGSIFSPNSRFTNRMIKEGAKLVSSYTDVLEELNLNVVARQSEMPLDFAPEDEGETDLLRHLHEEPVHIDDIRRSASLPITAVSSMLSILEIKGKVKQVGCMHYVRMQEPTATYGN